MPDEELLKLAERGVLGQPHELRQQIDRPLKDLRATALVRRVYRTMVGT